MEKSTNSSINISKLFVALITILYFLYYAGTYEDWHFLDNFSLIIHEAGHTITFFLGDTIRVLAGSGFQILIPIVFIFYFYMRSDHFSSTLLLFWLGQNIMNVSVYVSDAIYMQLPLLGGGGENSIHDWNYILNSFGILQYTHSISSVLYILGISTIILASYFSIILCQNKYMDNNLIEN